MNLNTLLMLFIAGLTAWCYPSSVAVAEANFSTDQEITYTLNANGQTDVVQKVTITNLKDDVIASTYSINLNSLKILDITGEINGRKTELRKKEEDSEITLTATISNPLIGKGRQNKVVIFYKTNDFANKTGRTWNINIPSVQLNETLSTINLSLSVPTEMGGKMYLSPTPTLEKKSDKETTYFFVKENLNGKNITGAFGEFQLINFKLKYQIYNPSLLSAKAEIALPYDINSLQRIKFSSISPKPDKIYMDSDGNAIGIFTVGGKKRVNIEVYGYAKLTSREINPEFGGLIKDTPSKLKNAYTSSEKYWETTSAFVTQTATELKDTSGNTVKTAQNIYNYLVDKLSYDYDAYKAASVQRAGAEKTLAQKGAWTCMEFTDTFVAMARSLGIPAREINGYAFSNDTSNKPVSINLRGGDLLHAWPEFYDPNYGWIQVDPTWGNTSGADFFTKLDTNHFALVVHGKNSEYPLPAGTYRIEKDEKLVDVDFSVDSADMDFEGKFEVKDVWGFNIFELIKGKKKVCVNNVSGVFVNFRDKIVVPPFQTACTWL